ncbi:MAG: hypothetical protein N2C14_23450 [Planctomycetales bacterium]
MRGWMDADNSGVVLPRLPTQDQAIVRRVYFSRRSSREQGPRSCFLSCSCFPLLLSDPNNPPVRFRWLVRSRRLDPVANPNNMIKRTTQPQQHDRDRRDQERS